MRGAFGDERAKFTDLRFASKALIERLWRVGLIAPGEGFGQYAITARGAQWLQQDDARRAHVESKRLKVAA